MDLDEEKTNVSISGMKKFYTFLLICARSSDIKMRLLRKVSSRSYLVQEKRIMDLFSFLLNLKTIVFVTKLLNTTLYVLGMP